MCGLTKTNDVHVLRIEDGWSPAPHVRQRLVVVAVPLLFGATFPRGPLVWWQDAITVGPTELATVYLGQPDPSVGVQISDLFSMETFWPVLLHGLLRRT